MPEAQNKPRVLNPISQESLKDRNNEAGPALITRDIFKEDVSRNNTFVSEKKKKKSFNAKSNENKNDK